MQRIAPEFLDALLDAAPDALVVVDEDGHIHYANSQAERLFGYPPQALLGRPVEDLVPPERAERHRAHRRAYAARPERRTMGEREVLEAVRGDGRRIPVEIALSPLRVGDRAFVVGAVREAGERLRHQRRLEAQARRLERSQADLQRVTRAIAGQLQAPARQVRQYAELFETAYGEALEPAGRECLESLAYAARRIERQLAALGAYLNLSEGRVARAPLPLEEVLAEVRRRLRYPIEDREASVQVMPGLPVVMADPTLCVELFHQLLDNALTHGGESPWIVVRALETEGDSVVVSVRDNGPGIPPEVRPRLFEPFHKAGGEGLGMGLALARRIAEVHGGDLWLAEETRGGADFRVRLPCLS